VDSTPPAAPTIVSAVWNEATDRFTITMRAPADTDLRELRLYVRKNDDVPPAVVGTPVWKGAVAAGGTTTYVCAVNVPAGSLGPGETWVAANSTHGVIQAGWALVAVDTSGNVSRPATKTAVVAASRKNAPRPVSIPKIAAAASKSRAYDFAGARADSQWGNGIMHTGKYPSGNHGTQWCGIYIPASATSAIRGRDVTSMKLKFYVDHTYSNAGATFSIGWHAYASGMPNTLPANASKAYFRGCTRSFKVKKDAWATYTVPLAVAQKIIDGEAYGFILGAPQDSSTSNYSALKISSVSISVSVK
jgi:hypothetical protein